MRLCLWAHHENHPHVPAALKIGLQARTPITGLNHVKVELQNVMSTGQAGGASEDGPASAWQDRAKPLQGLDAGHTTNDVRLLHEFEESPARDIPLHRLAVRRPAPREPRRLLPRCQHWQVWHTHRAEKSAEHYSV